MPRQISQKYVDEIKMLFEKLQKRKIEKTFKEIASGDLSKLDSFDAEAVLEMLEISHKLLMHVGSAGFGAAVEGVNQLLLMAMAQLKRGKEQVAIAPTA